MQNVQKENEKNIEKAGSLSERRNSIENKTSSDYTSRRMKEVKEHE